MPQVKPSRRLKGLTARQATKGQEEEPSEAESLAALVGLIKSIPVQTASDGLPESAEPAAKRTKTAGGHRAICIAREQVLLPVLDAAIAPENTVITRLNVGEKFVLRLDEPSHSSKDWQLCFSRRGKSRDRGFRVEYAISEGDLSRKQASALAVAGKQPFDPGEHGCIWASVDVCIQQDGTAVELELSIQVNWNESLSVWGNSQLPSQQSLRNEGLTTWLPELRQLHIPTPTSASPQDFYEAAHIPDKEAFNAEVGSLQAHQLQANLYPFQRRAVQWLLRREGVHWQRGPEDGQGSVRPYVSPDADLPVTFSEAKDTDGEKFYLSRVFGVATRDFSPFLSIQNFRGGILAEEMGLGKTLEVIALMLLHRRPEGPMIVYDYYLGRELLATPATLIVAPSSLLEQWLSELDRHAPTLKVLHYPGLKKASKRRSEMEISAEYMDEHDVVITTYEVLRTELWLASDEPTRSMRNAKQYQRPISPLVQLSWWRVCIDEAQMVENWTNNAAKFAKRIPRINSWAITGTPVKDDTQKDLRGLLNFLRCEPYASDAKIWNDFVTADKTLFREFVGIISMRHTKSLVRNEISIPAQRRYVITMPFTAVEEQHYQSLFQDMAASCGLDAQGNPLQENWDPEDPAVQHAMRTALDRLRQTALHPEVGNRNRRALGQKISPMRTVAEVLDAMLEQTDAAKRADQRSLLSLRVTKGQILAGQQRVQAALALWEEVREKSTAIVSECRQQLDHEIREARKGASDKSQASSGDDENDDREDALSPQVGDARRRLRSALEVQHRAVFYCANGYFSIKSNEEMTVPDSADFKRLEEMEVEGYDHAKAIRKEILQEGYGKAKSLMGRLAKSAEDQSFAVIPESTSIDQQGIESRKIAEALEIVCGKLDDQANQLDDWREHVIQLLLKPLVDEDNEEITGEEYEQSTKLQDEILVYLQVLRAAIADRQAVISGQKNFLVEHEIKVAARFAVGGDGPFPEKLLQLLKIRDAIRPHLVEADPLTSLRGVISELRGLSVKLRHDATNGNTRAGNELTIVTNMLKHTLREQAEQMKAVTTMEHEIERFTDTLNARLAFYRQLQAVSDMVGEYEGSTDDAALHAIVTQEKALEKKLSAADAKHRYLLHLKEAESNSEEQRMCVICQSPFSIGVLTVCGHQFCKECITLWFKAHKNCPVCKRQLNQSNLHDITFKPQELQVHSEGQQDVESCNQSQTSPTKKTCTIYSEFNPEKLAEIKNIDLDGPNYTTKVDTLVRHLLWLRESDPGAKSIVFSQYKEFLEILAIAFRRYRIGYTSFDKAHGITNFKEDPGTEVFLLHARAHASGLNLVNASHVFLCEPLLNTALELQAIARVDRIGQQHETTVWLYIVDGTVEESIYNLSVQRRIEHMGRNLKEKSKESTPELLDANLDAANALEMQHAHLSKLMGKDGISGEAVDKKDLWTCLFGHVRASGEERRLVDNPVTRGFLAAEAADERHKAAGSVAGPSE